MGGEQTRIPRSAFIFGELRVCQHQRRSGDVPTWGVRMCRGSATAAGGENQPRSVEAELRRAKASCHRGASDGAES